MLTRISPLVALVLAATLAPAQEAPAVPECPRPRLALVLSGGGARGIAHIGALRALEEAGIPVDAITANSMGSIVGGVYATGKSAAELERIVRSLDWASLFSGRVDRRTLPVSRRVDRYVPTAGVNFDWKSIRLQGGLLAEHRVNRFLIEVLSPASYAANGDFDRLAIRFRAVAGDLGTGDQVVLARGDLARAVRASMSIPLVFPPVDWEGKRLVDGLIVNNLPVDVARALDPQVVVAVDIGSPPLEPEGYESSLGVTSQVSDILARRRYRDFAAEADVLVRPDLEGHSSTQYSGFDRLIEQGYAATRAALPAIREKLAAAGVTDLAPRRNAPAGPALEGATIRAVRVEGTRRVSEGLARRLFSIPVGPGFRMERGLRAFDRVDATELFERTWMEFSREGDGVDVVLRVKESPPNRVEFGLGYSEWEKARGSLGLINRNTLGFGEQLELLAAVSDAETLAELSLRGDRLFVPGLGFRLTGYYHEEKPRFFAGEPPVGLPGTVREGEETGSLQAGDEINRARFKRLGVEVALRTSLKRWGFAEAGARFGRVATEDRAGLTDPDDPILVEATDPPDQVGALFGRVVFDTLDDLSWPEHGRRVSVRGEWHLKDLGSDYAYWRALGELRVGRRLGPRLTAQIDGLAGFSGQDLPAQGAGPFPLAYDWYRIGGVTLIPGYRREELKGPQALAAALSFRYRMVGQLRLVLRGGAGNVFNRIDDVTFDGLRWGVGVGIYHPTPIGPLSFETGFTRRDRVSDEGVTTRETQFRNSVTIGWN
jgi:NTE family protein